MVYRYTDVSKITVHHSQNINNIPESPEQLLELPFPLKSENQEKDFGDKYDDCRQEINLNEEN